MPNGTIVMKVVDQVNGGGKILYVHAGISTYASQ
jgi:hypothetical protein